MIPASSLDNNVGQITRSRGKKNRSYFESIITQSIFQLQRRSKAQNVGNWTGLLDNIPYFRWQLWQKSSPDLKFSSFWKFLKYSMQLQFHIGYGKIVPNYARKNIFMAMTSSMTSQEDFEIVPIYSLINEKWTFFIITEQITEKSPLHIVYICTIGLWICVYK